MSAPKWTPGPLAVNPDAPRDVLDATGELVATFYPMEGAPEAARANALRYVAVDDLAAALEAVLVMWDRGPCPKKLDEALSWRENDERARAMASAALAKAGGAA